MRAHTGGLALALAALAGLGPAATVAHPQPWRFSPHAERTAYLTAPAGVGDTGLLGFANPALVARLSAPESLFLWSSGAGGRHAAPRWGAFSAVPHLGFGMLRRDEGRSATTQYRLALAGGGRGAAFGAAWGWSTGTYGPDPAWTLGTILQPSARLSLGGTWTSTRDGETREATGHLGLRPLGTPRLSLFAEGARSRGDVDDDWLRVGAEAALGAATYLTASRTDGGLVRLELRVEAGGAGARLGGLHRRHGSGVDEGLYGVRLGPDRGDLRTPWRRRRAFLHLDLQGPVRHRTYPLLDDGRAQLDLLATLRRVETDPALGGVAVNLSGLRIDAAMAWELRQRLQALRDAGKAVVVYIDRVDLRRYHLASVADRIVIDPAGLVVVHGFAAGQLYLRGALDKLGIGTQEWRYHEYKSAFETFTRQDMSARDREQWQALVDDDYARARRDITAARALTPAAFDHLVDEVTALGPKAAVAEGLVDTIGRWDTVESMVAALGGGDRLVAPNQLAVRADPLWGAPPTVAVVYALGECAMYSGIQARSLATQLRNLADDDGVDAVVLRVDSPGGDVLASDVVAGALAEVHTHKPVVVSQARLAASGGYWISLESDAIVATPATLTGSIGVIGGWLYDDGFGQRLGLSVDHVQAGRHADLGLGLPLPLLGSLPERALTEEEVARTRQVMGDLYDDFVQRVARARGRSAAAVDSVARGRVWSGSAALDAGLVDRLGGLDTAIDLARDLAGGDPRRPVTIRQLPRLGWLAMRDLPGLLSLRGAAALGLPLPGASPPDAGTAAWLRFRLEHNGEPLLLLPAPYLNAADGLDGDWR